MGSSAVMIVIVPPMVCVSTMRPPSSTFVGWGFLRDHPPTGEIKIMVDSVQDIRRKDLIGAATAYKTEQKSLEKGISFAVSFNDHTSLKRGSGVKKTNARRTI